MAEKSKEHYELRKQLKFLKNLKGSGTELISIYIPPGYFIAEVTNKLRDEYGQAANIKSKPTRKNVQAAIDRILTMLRGIPKPPANGVAIFAGNIRDKIEMYTVLPPEPIPIQTYRCDSTFFLDPLLDMVVPKELYGLLVIDRREATIGLLRGKKIDVIEKESSGVPGKHHKGGQSAPRFQRLIELAAHEFFVRIGEYANPIFRDPKVKGIIIGGPGGTKNEFIKGDYLQTAVKDKIMGALDTSYTDEYGLKELMDNAGDLIKGLDVAKEKELVNKFIKDAVTGGLATYGEQFVRDAISSGKAHTVLISEGLDLYRIKYKCANCGREYERTSRKEEEFKCDCGGRVAAVEKKELTEELAELAESRGLKVEMISTDTPEGEQFRTGFGGIGALLRYK